MPQDVTCVRGDMISRGILGNSCSSYSTEEIMTQINKLIELSFRPSESEEIDVDNVLGHVEVGCTCIRLKLRIAC